MSKSPNSKSEASAPARTTRFRGAYRALVFLAVCAVSVLLIFPWFFGPAIDGPADPLSGNPLLLTFRLANANLTPLSNFEYTCEPVEVHLQNGDEVKDIKVVTQGRFRRFQGRRAIPVQCETAYLIDAPFKSAEYRLTVHYRAFPWPQERTKEYRFVAAVDAQGKVTKWNVK